MKAVLTLLRHRRGLLLAVLCLLQGCSIHQYQLNELATTLDQGNASEVLNIVSQRDYSEQDYVQYKLTLGLLRAVNGDFSGSITELQAAKREIKQLQAVSVSENLGAVTVNETLRSYASTASERMLLQQLLILSYLMQDDLSGARVEVLQMQELAKSLPDEGLSGLVASSHYLAGLVYELGREQDNAMISYRQAYQVMQASKIAAPKALQDSLLLFSHKLGLKSEYQRYVKTFGYTLNLPAKNQSQLVMLYWGGTVSAKQQRFMSVYQPSLGYNISLALPYYKDNYTAPKPLRFSVEGQTADTELLDDVDRLARADLEAESAAIYAAALTRVILKQTALHEIKKKDEDGLVTLLLNVASMVTESADVRSWNMLPASIQISRITLDTGNYYLQQPGLNHGLMLTRSAPGLGKNATVIVPSADFDEAELATSQQVSDHTADQDSVTEPKVLTADTLSVSATTDAKLVAAATAPEVSQFKVSPGQTVLLFYSSAAQKAYRYLAP
jgi:hypothetical protein